ncbi:MAG: helix-turn-helix transcriptional regulator [Candidatus Gastranaerophilales bacterium]|nr:helix-turn-helix transcriptional regulator [Candidatus Gastranaerophilales bacterium]
MSRLKKLGENIRKYRELRGLKQIDLAVSLDFSGEYICRVERGQKYMSLRKLFKLADILKVKVSDLIDFD